FFSQASSKKNAEIDTDSRVQLFYGNTGSSEYLTVAGNATIIKNEAKAKELWTRWAKPGLRKARMTLN
ncbi:MAG: pyridoxamine 5'-phosphate oxidase family protein, partial [Aquabacterium sp.]|nr:pyridoxamine 5'-phosphate oxidase family protein [Ferruginibacter sp.]